ncbi:hypothetical protein ACFX5Q_24720 [Mesorhizobium sp. IMUNJ 23033]
MDVLFGRSTHAELALIDEELRRERVKFTGRDLKDGNASRPKGAWG